MLIYCILVGLGAAGALIFTSVPWWLVVLIVVGLILLGILNMLMNAISRAVENNEESKQ